MFEWIKDNNTLHTIEMILLETKVKWRSFNVFSFVLFHSFQVVQVSHTCTTFNIHMVDAHHMHTFFVSFSVKYKMMNIFLFAYVCVCVCFLCSSKELIQIRSSLFIVGSDPFFSLYCSFSIFLSFSSLDASYHRLILYIRTNTWTAFICIVQFF